MLNPNFKTYFGLTDDESSDDANYDCYDEQDYGGGNYWDITDWTTKRTQDYASPMDYSQGNSSASELRVEHSMSEIQMKVLLCKAPNFLPSQPIRGQYLYESRPMRVLHSVFYYFPSCVNIFPRLRRR